MKRLQRRPCTDAGKARRAGQAWRSARRIPTYNKRSIKTTIYQQDSPLFPVAKIAELL
jgi:hypothetical protein